MRTRKLSENKYLKYWYWSIPIILTIIQLIFTLNSLNQIKQEELAESVRSVYWFHKHLIYHPISTNLGWYAVLDIINSFFGFWLFSAKIYKIFLQLIALFCLADVLRKFLKEKIAAIPLVTFGISPTFIYFNTLAISIGTDVQYFLICVWAIITLPKKDNFLTYVRLFLIGFLLMIAELSYPGFLLLFLLSVVVLVRKTQKIKSQEMFTKIKKGAVLFLGVITPIIGLLFYIHNTAFLLPYSDGSGGLFRGNAVIQLNFQAINNGLKMLISDFFFRSNSYYFDLNKVEFSDYYTVIGILTILFLSSYIWYKYKKYRLIITVLWLLLIFNFGLGITIGGGQKLSGIRRNLAILVSLYGLFTVCLYWLTSRKNFKYKPILLSFLLIIPLHHMLVLPVNLRHISGKSVFADKWFQSPDPQKDLAALISHLSIGDLQLSCQDQSGNLVYCRYVEIYSVLAASCEYNHLVCYNIKGYDIRTNSFEVLDVASYQSGRLLE